ncbi:MAG: FtsX-like permease family protein [Ignavibacteriaceae bacterium]|mgnify:CR=1 FL=1|nr:MAG: ABC transporter permease [Chlorobiota bacterium]KXK04868.1 MAG: ABC-type transport system, permease component [Chlorobi bacterium OLB4]MBV6397685.1 hypothetical protein [Ignavibacteria bacterium]MCC6885465.1 FtsX-like permease family protein [Ignavibacteriales bacterium]MCE7952817.1 ABC transporter permease [Chlorobi bacterium CHB7]MDL1887016.1 FtsX-like permease family protein [Ignavibacteria bacterium CHB1]MEB2328788.1 FtsX-like permease family protein [Ignavibacteriaceae bacterium]
MTNLLHRSGYKYFSKHPWQVFLSILGIALGVAAVVSVDIAGQSSRQAFEQSMEIVSGKTTHQIISEPTGVQDSLFTFLRIEKGIIPSAPIVEKFATLEHNGERRTFRMLGIDVFCENDFRDYILSATNEIKGGLGGFLSGENKCIISSITASDLNISENDTLDFTYGGRKFQLEIGSIFNVDQLSNPSSLNDVIILDISTAKKLFDMNNRLSRIDLILSDDEIATVRSYLPPGALLKASDIRSGSTFEMLSAFDLNIKAMSFLALIVGIFLVYNTATFSVVQRRRLIGLYRTLGVTKFEVFSIIIRESVILGIAGTVLGLMAGVFMGKELVKIVVQSINDLYFVVNVTDTDISTEIIIKGILLGLGASVIASLKPAKEASDSPAGNVLIRSDIETSLKKNLRIISALGFGLICMSIIVFYISGKNIEYSYVGILPLILGYSLLVPIVIIFITRVTAVPIKKIFGITGKVASVGIVSSLSRTGVSIAALSIAVAASIGVGTMVSGFRSTVVSWLQSTLEADLYISAPSLIGRSNTSTIDDINLPQKIEKLPGVESVNYYREIQILTNYGLTTILGSKYNKRKFNTYRIKEGNMKTLWNEVTTKDRVMITEPFAYKHNLKVGSIIKLPTQKGERDFEVAAIYYDYASDMGIVNIWYSTYRKYWNDEDLSGVAVYVNPASDINKISDDIRKLINPGQEILIRTNKYLRETSIDIFDRTFIIAYVIQLLSVAVAFIGILSSLLALQLERAKEYGILRAIGMTPGQLWRMVTLQTGLMGFIAGLISVPLGNFIAVILIYVINKRSFGWSLHFEILPLELFLAIVLSVFAATLAGIYPGIRMSKTSPSLALREE